MIHGKKEKDCQDSAGLRSNSGLGDCQVSTQASRGSNDDDSFEMLASRAAAQNCCLVALKCAPKHVHNLCTVQICRSTNLCCSDMHQHHGVSGAGLAVTPGSQRLRTTLNQRSRRWYFRIEIN